MINVCGAQNLMFTNMNWKENNSTNLNSTNCCMVEKSDRGNQTCGNALLIITR